MIPVQKINLDSVVVVDKACSMKLKVLSVSEPLTQADIDRYELQNLQPGDRTIQFRALSATRLEGIDPEDITTFKFLSFVDRGSKMEVAPGLLLTCQIEEYHQEERGDTFVITAVSAPKIEKATLSLADFLKAANTTPDLTDENEDEEDEDDEAEAAAKAAAAAAAAKAAKVAAKTGKK